MDIKTKYNIGDVVFALVEFREKKECFLCESVGTVTILRTNGENTSMVCPKCYGTKQLESSETKFIPLKMEVTDIYIDISQIGIKQENYRLRCVDDNDSILGASEENLQSIRRNLRCIYDTADAAKEKLKKVEKIYKTSVPF